MIRDCKMKIVKVFKVLSFRLFACFLLISLSVLAAGPSSAQPVQLKAGYGERDITPDVSVKDWVTGKEYGKVNDPLFTRVIVIGDGKTKSVIVSLDLVDAGESLTDEIRKSVSKVLMIPEGNTMVSSTHTHSAPWSPVYKSGYRGTENDTWWAIRYIPAQNNYAPFKKWMQRLLDQVTQAALEADKKLQPATLWVGKADISAFANNRRPVRPKWGTIRNNAPKGYGIKHEAFVPEVQTDGANYGPMDRTMSLVSFRDAQGNNIAALYHMSVHAVSIYPYDTGISADWPGEATKNIEKSLGGKAIFLQGTAGDIVPWRRGREAVNEMGKGLAWRAKGAFDLSVQLATDSIIVRRASAALPLDQKGKERTGLELVQAEVQVVAIGPLALVTLPGEPLTDMGVNVRARSPFPHTLVLGYSNGNGVHYVAPPGEKAKGGYEMESGTVGEGEAGQILIEAAVRLLNSTVRVPSGK